MITKQNFGQVLQALKEGQIAYREGWNGRGMYIFLNKGSRDVSEVSIDKLPEGADTVEGLPFYLFEIGATGTYTRLPNINMRNAHGRTVTGWLASQTDMLAEDWCIEGRAVAGQPTTNDNTAF